MNLYEQQSSNRRKTVFIVFVFVLFFLAIGLGFDYFFLSVPAVKPVYADDVAQPLRIMPIGTVISLVIALAFVANSFWNGASTVLSSALARPADLNNPQERQFINVVEELSLAAGLKPPRAYVVPDSDPNAFAAGLNPDEACVAVTQGLLSSLNRTELEGVIAHELGHVKNYDTRLMTVLAALGGAIVLLSDWAGRSMRYGGGRSSSSSKSKGGGNAVFFAVWLLLIIFAPLITRLLAMAISRQREYLADASGAELTRNPLSLASALEKIKSAAEPTRSITNGVAHMCIADPRGEFWEEKENFLGDLFATHPSMEKRIVALKLMAYQAQQGETA